MTTEPASPASPARLLDDPDPEARRRGAQRIGELGGTVAVSMLSRALADEDWRVRKEAAAVAPSIAPRTEVLACLFRALADRERVGLRNAAVEALLLVGSDAVQGAVQALAELDPDGRKLAVEVLAGIPGVEGTRALVRALRDEDINVRATAAEALGMAGLSGAAARALAVQALTEMLEVGEPLRCLAALNSLLRLDATLPWAVLAPLTRDRLLGRSAVAAAARTRETAAIEALTRMICDAPLAAGRDALVAVVGCIATETTSEDLVRLVREELRANPAARDRVRALTTEEAPQVRGAALALLGLFRVRSDVPELVRALTDRDVSESAELGLRWFGEEVLPELLREGELCSPQVRAVTLSLVPLLAETADEATLASLRGALGADSVPVVVAASTALGAVGSGADLAILAPYVTAREPRISAIASAALARIASRHPDDARALTRALSADSRAAVVGCLLRGATARHRSPDESADLSFLRAALDHDDVRVRRAAVDTLADIGGPTAAVVVARALADEERDVVLAAVRALGTMKQADPLLAVLEDARDTAVVAAALRALSEASPERGIDAAWSLLRSEDPLVAASAIETIGPSRGPRRDEALFLSLDHADPGVVKSALALLARDLSPRTLAHVGACLDSESYEVRRFSAELLGGADDPAAQALIRARLDRETDPVVRQALMLSLTSRRPGGDGP